MSEDRSALEIISDIDEFIELHDFVKDSDIDEALSLVVRLITKPDITVQKAPPVIVKLQALSAKFQVLAVYYTTLGKGSAGTDNNYKKNIFYTMSDALDKLSNSLKFLVRGGY